MFRMSRGAAVSNRANVVSPHFVVSSRGVKTFDEAPRLTPRVTLNCVNTLDGAPLQCWRARDAGADV